MQSNNQDRKSAGKKGFLFNVDILVEGYSNGIALENLIAILNRENAIKDYRLQKGVELGQIIDATASANPHQREFALPQDIRHLTSASSAGHLTQPAAPASKSSASVTPINKAPADNTVEAKNDDNDLLKLIEYFRSSNTLVRLNIVKAKGVTLSIPCRILNLDRENQNVTVYHVDEKKVYQFPLSEIDDFKVS